MDAKLALLADMCQGQDYVRFLAFIGIAWHSARMTTTETPVSRGWRVDDSTFGARLALVRQRMDWNIKEAARECGVPGASWRTWERDGVKPRDIVEIAGLIAERTGCEYVWLLAGPNPESRHGRQPILQSVPLAEKTRPNGRPKGTTPPRTSRRPARVTHALLGYTDDSIHSGTGVGVEHGER